MRTLTIQDTISLHRTLWHWIEQKTLERHVKVELEEYFRENHIPSDEIPNSKNYCCEYDEQQLTGWSCENCPFDWQSNCEVSFCYDKEKSFDNNGLLKQWDAIANDDWKQAAKLARIIAELPEREHKI